MLDMTEGGYLVEMTGGDFSTALEMTEGERLVEMTFRPLHARYLSL